MPAVACWPAGPRSPGPGLCGTVAGGRQQLAHPALQQRLQQRQAREGSTNHRKWQTSGSPAVVSSAPTAAAGSTSPALTFWLLSGSE
jgi:hypothetical protein